MEPDRHAGCSVPALPGRRHCGYYRDIGRRADLANQCRDHPGERKRRPVHFGHVRGTFGFTGLDEGAVQGAFSIGNAREFGKYFGSVLVDFGMDQVQQAGVKDAVANREDENRGSQNPQ